MTLHQNFCDWSVGDVLQLPPILKFEKMSSRRREAESGEEAERESDNEPEQQQPVVANGRGDDDDRDRGGDGGGDGGSEDSPRMVPEIHAMLRVLLRSFNIPLPRTGIEDDKPPKRVRKLKAKMLAVVATPAARGIEGVIQYIITEFPRMIHEIMR